MQETLARRATYADIEAAPSHLVAEILNGVLVTHPRGTGRHGRTHFRLGSVLGSLFEDELDGLRGPGGWVFITEPELHFGDDGDVTVPELAGWRIERLPPPPAPDPLDPVKIRLAPDWVCEVLSPSTEKYDRGDKSDIYAHAGIGHYWLADPRSETLETFELVGGRFQLVGSYRGRQALHLAPFDAAELDFARIWPPRRAP